jgi:hypothetical protein
MIKDGNFKREKEVQSYSKGFYELTLSPEGFILRDDRLIIPFSLQNKIIDLAHEGHLGIVKTKKLLRSKVWFPRINRLVEEKIKPCLACQASVSTGSRDAPIQMSKMPEAQWLELSLDFYGPIKPMKEYLLVIVDDYSRFPWVEIISSLTGQVVIKKLEHLLSVFGIPEIIRTDNGPPFNSKEFKHFSEQMNIKHRLITPEWPMANGIVESFMKNLGKVLKTASVDKISWKRRLIEFLRNYRSTPHSSTGIPPASLLFKNANTSRLPSYGKKYSGDSVDRNAAKSDKQSKKRMKEKADRKLRVGKVNVKIGDVVLLKQKKVDKHSTPYEASPYKVIAINGTMFRLLSRLE